MRAETGWHLNNIKCVCREIILIPVPVNPRIASIPSTPTLSTPSISSTPSTRTHTRMPGRLQGLAKAHDVGSVAGWNAIAEGTRELSQALCEWRTVFRDLGGLERLVLRMREGEREERRGE